MGTAKRKLTKKAQCEDTLRKLIVEIVRREAWIVVRDPILFGEGKRGYLEGITDARMVCASNLILMENGQKRGSDDLLSDIIKAVEKHIPIMRKAIEKDDPDFMFLSYVDKLSYIEACEDIIDMLREWQKKTPVV